MKKLTLAAAYLAVAVMVFAFTGISVAATALTADQALDLLMDGNRHFVKGDLENLEKMSSPRVRKALAAGQSPYAVVVDCSDSRLSPEIIFDKGLGEVFVVRVAGNIVAPHQLGSIEYALEHLGAKLVMVLGHTNCGAVKATVGALDANCEVPESAREGNIGSLLEAIAPAAEKACKSGTADVLNAAIDENISHVASNIEHDSAVVKEYIETKGIKLVTGKYDLTTGIVTLMAE